MSEISKQPLREIGSDNANSRQLAHGSSSQNAASSVRMTRQTPKELAVLMPELFSPRARQQHQQQQQYAALLRASAGDDACALPCSEPAWPAEVPAMAKAYHHVEELQQLLPNVDVCKVQSVASNAYRSVHMAAVKHRCGPELWCLDHSVGANIRACSRWPGQLRWVFNGSRGQDQGSV